VGKLTGIAPIFRSAARSGTQSDGHVTQSSNSPG
jgi:hypothetical protein